MKQLEQTWLRDLPCEALTARRRMVRRGEEHPTSPPHRLRGVSVVWSFDRRSVDVCTADRGTSWKATLERRFFPVGHKPFTHFLKKTRRKQQKFKASYPIYTESVCEEIFIFMDWPINQPMKIKVSHFCVRRNAVKQQSKHCSHTTASNVQGASLHAASQQAIAMRDNCARPLLMPMNETT